MNNYEKLLNEAATENIKVYENVEFESSCLGLAVGDKIALNDKIPTQTEKTCILAEELGHYYTTVGNILNQESINNRKQEQHARIWAYNRLIGLSGIIDSYKKGCRTAFDMAEYLNVTEKFLAETLQCYRAKYGICTKIDNYVIYFEPPIGVFELI